jgi:hypothetical protein
MRLVEAALRQTRYEVKYNRKKKRSGYYFANEPAPGKILISVIKEISARSPQKADTNTSLDNSIIVKISPSARLPCSRSCLGIVITPQRPT